MISMEVKLPRKRNNFNVLRLAPLQTTTSNYNIMIILGEESPLNA
jgi:hypothetical protein